MDEEILRTLIFKFPCDPSPMVLDGNEMENMEEIQEQLRCEKLEA